MESWMRVSAEQVRALRSGKAWSQEHLAECAGVSLRTVQRVEADGGASHETVMALASALGVTPAELGAESAVRRAVPLGHTLGVALSVVGTLVGLAAAWNSVILHAQGAAADQAYGTMGLLTGLGCAWMGLIVGRWFKARGVHGWPLAGASSALLVATVAAVGLGVGQRVVAAETISVRVDGQHAQDFVHGEMVTEDGYAAVMELGKELRLEVVPSVTPEGRVMLRLKLYAFREGKLELISSPALLVANKDTAAVELNPGSTADGGTPYRFELTPTRNESVP
jgi:DNA-binding XRE family transcriptional regulator